MHWSQIQQNLQSSGLEYLESSEAFWIQSDHRFYQIDWYKDQTFMYAIYDSDGKYIRFRKHRLLKNFQELPKIEAIARQTLWNYIFKDQNV